MVIDLLSSLFLYLSYLIYYRLYNLSHWNLVTYKTIFCYKKKSTIFVLTNVNIRIIKLI